MVRIAGFHSWAAAADRGENKGRQCRGAKPLTTTPGLPWPLYFVPFCFAPTKMPPPPRKERLNQMMPELLATLEIQGHYVLSVWLQGHLPMKLSSPKHPAPPQTEGPFRASHLCHCEGGSILKSPWVSPSVWYVAGESDNRMCFQKGDPLNPCVLRLNRRDPVLIPCTGWNTLIIHLWALPVEVGRSGLVEVPDNPPLKTGN